MKRQNGFGSTNLDSATQVRLGLETNPSPVLASKDKSLSFERTVDTIITSFSVPGEKN